MFWPTSASAHQPEFWGVIWSHHHHPSISWTPSTLHTETLNSTPSHHPTALWPPCCFCLHESDCPKYLREVGSAALASISFYVIFSNFSYFLSCYLLLFLIGFHRWSVFSSISFLSFNYLSSPIVLSSLISYSILGSFSLVFKDYVSVSQEIVRIRHLDCSSFVEDFYLLFVWGICVHVCGIYAGVPCLFSSVTERWTQQLRGHVLADEECGRS